MRLFFPTTLPRPDADERELALGINTANFELLFRIHEHSRVIREIGLVCENEADRHQIERLFPSGRVRGYACRTRSETAETIRSHDFVFTGGYKMDDLLDFEPRGPVIGLTHSLHTPNIPDEIRLANRRCRPNDVLIATSTAGLDVVRRMLAPEPHRFRLEHIPLGVDERRFHPTDAADKVRLRRDFGIPDDAVVFSSVGRLTPGGKAELAPLIVAFARLLASCPTARKRALLLLVGREVLPGYSEALLAFAKSLNIAGKVGIVHDYAVARLPDYYAASDVFVAPSDNTQETFGLAVLEAMATGLPVIASDWSGFRDTVAHGQTGYLVHTYWAPCGFSPSERFRIAQSLALDMPALVSSMQSLVEDTDLRRDMGQASRERAHEYSWERVIEMFDRLFASLTSPASASLLTGIPDTAPHAATDDWFSLFEGYPTRILGQHDRVVAVTDQFHAYESVRELLDSDLLGILPRIIGHSLSLAQWREIFVPLLGSDLEVLRHVMLLLKYGVLELDLSPPQSAV